MIDDFANFGHCKFLDVLDYNINNQVVGKDSHLYKQMPGMSDYTHIRNISVDNQVTIIKEQCQMKRYLSKSPKKDIKRSLTLLKGF